jgi:hypothetical protein
MNVRTKTVVYNSFEEGSRAMRENRITLPAAPWERETGAKQGPRLVVNNAKSLKRLAHPVGFEPTTSAFGGQPETAKPLIQKQLSKTDIAQIVRNQAPNRGETGAKIPHRRGVPPVPVTIRGVTYPSRADAAKALGIHPNNISASAKKGTLDLVGLGRGVNWKGARA